MSVKLSLTIVSGFAETPLVHFSVVAMKDILWLATECHVKMLMSVPQAFMTVNKVVPILSEALSAHVLLDMYLIMTKEHVLVSSYSSQTTFA